MMHSLLSNDEEGDEQYGTLHPQSLEEVLEDYFRIFKPLCLENLAEYTKEAESDPANFIRGLEQENPHARQFFLHYEYHFASKFFDPLKALYDNNVVPPYPLSRPLDNLHKAQILVPTQIRSLVGLGVLHEQAVAQRDKDWMKGVLPPTLIDWLADSVSEGPMQRLREYYMHRTLIRIRIRPDIHLLSPRNYSIFRELLGGDVASSSAIAASTDLEEYQSIFCDRYITGYLRGFDNDWNLLLVDASEKKFTRSTRLATVPTAVTDTYSQLTTSTDPQSSVSSVALDRKQGHVKQDDEHRVPPSKRPHTVQYASPHLHCASLRSVKGDSGRPVQVTPHPSPPLEKISSSQVVFSSAKELPVGWVMLFTYLSPDGGEVTHNAQRTSTDAHQQDDTQAPTPYYFNLITGESRWSPPEPVDLCATFPPCKSPSCSKTEFDPLHSEATKLRNNGKLADLQAVLLYKRECLQTLIPGNLILHISEVGKHSESQNKATSSSSSRSSPPAMVLHAHTIAAKKEPLCGIGTFELGDDELLLSSKGMLQERDAPCSNTTNNVLESAGHSVRQGSKSNMAHASSSTGAHNRRRMTAVVAARLRR